MANVYVNVMNPYWEIWFSIYTLNWWAEFGFSIPETLCMENMMGFPAWAGSVDQMTNCGPFQPCSVIFSLYLFYYMCSLFTVVVV